MASKDVPNLSNFDTDDSQDPITRDNYNAIRRGNEAIENMTERELNDHFANNPDLQFGQIDYEQGLGLDDYKNNPGAYVGAYGGFIPEGAIVPYRFRNAFGDVMRNSYKKQKQFSKDWYDAGQARNDKWSAARLDTAPSNLGGFYDPDTQKLKVSQNDYTMDMFNYRGRFGDIGEYESPNDIRKDVAKHELVHRGMDVMGYEPRDEEEVTRRYVAKQEGTPTAQRMDLAKRNYFDASRNKDIDKSSEYVEKRFEDYAKYLSNFEYLKDK